MFVGDREDFFADLDRAADPVRRIVQNGDAGLRRLDAAAFQQAGQVGDIGFTLADMARQDAELRLCLGVCEGLQRGLLVFRPGGRSDCCATSSLPRTDVVSSSNKSWPLATISFGRTSTLSITPSIGARIAAGSRATTSLAVQDAQPHRNQTDRRYGQRGQPPAVFDAAEAGAKRLPGSGLVVPRPGERIALGDFREEQGFCLAPWLRAGESEDTSGLASGACSGIARR